MKKIKLGYFTQYDIRVSTTFIYDLIKSLKQEEELTTICYNGGVELNASFDSNSIGYSSKNIKWIYRLSRFSFLTNRTKSEFQLHLKKRQAFKILKKEVARDIDIAYIDFATTAVLLMDYFSVRKIPFVVHVHGYDITMQLNNGAYYKEVMRLFKLAEKFITASAYMKRRLILLGCPEDKIEVIRYGVKDDKVSIMSWDERKNRTPSVIFLGRLTLKKSPIALIHAFSLVRKKIPNAKFSIIGDGPLRRDVERLIEELQLKDSIKLYGALNRDESFPILREHWVYAQHSVTPITGDAEGFAISLAEAALHELPVVSTIHNGITENVVNGDTGFLVPEYDYESMANRIIELIQNPGLAEKMGKKGRDNILRKNQQEIRVKEIKDLLFRISTKK